MKHMVLDLALAGSLLAATSVAAGGQAPVRPAGPAPQAVPAQPTGASMLDDPQQTARRIPVTDAREALAKGEAVLVDVRAKEAFAASHAQGAISLPLWEIGARFAELPKDKLIITYCT